MTKGLDMTVAEMDEWIETLRDKLLSGEVYVQAIGPAPFEADVSGQVVTLMQRYEEMRSSAHALTQQERIDERIRAFREAQAALLAAHILPGGNGGVAHDSMKNVFDRLVDSYQFDTLRKEAAAYRAQAEDEWARDNKSYSQQLHNRAAVVEGRIADALSYEASRAKAERARKG